LFSLVIRPVLEPLGYSFQRADVALDHPTIPGTITQHIYQDDLVVADLTDSNANVFYELGKRHALNRPCVHLTSSLATLPFDMRHYRVLEYDLQDAERLETVRRELRLAVTSNEQKPPSPEFLLAPDDVIRLSGQTVVVRTASGRDAPYLVSKSIADADCKHMFLMQRSSSLILGPEQGWGAESEFYRTVLKRVKDGVILRHVVSLEGIVHHLQRPQSVFPGVENALENLSDVGGFVAIESKSGPMYIKKIKEQNERDDIKSDRQARIFLAEHLDGTTEGNFVFDVGGTQCSFQLRGSEVQHFIQRALDFYHEKCEYLRWSELTEALAPYREHRSLPVAES